VSTASDKSDSLDPFVPSHFVSTASNNSDSLNPLVPSQLLLWTFRTLCFVALTISGYLAWTAFTATEVFGCGGGDSVFDCDHVLTSKYAKVWGIPVSVPAFGLYASLLAVLMFMKPSAPQNFLRAGWAMLSFGAFSAAMAAVWFISVQVFKLEHLCAYCIGAHSCGLILAGIVIWKRPLPFRMTAGLSGASLAGIAVLITSQTMSSEPDSFVIERFDDEEPQASGVADVNSSGEFGAPVEFGAPAEFGAPVVFGAPEETSAPTEFSPPAADGLFSPPPTGDVTSQLDAVDVPLLEVPVPPNGKLPATTSVDGVQSPGTINIAGTAAFLFFSPSSGNLAYRLLSHCVIQGDGEEAVDSETTESAKDDSSTTQAAAKPVVKKPAAPIERMVPVHDSKFSLNSRHWPLLGDPDAKYIFVEMFDYTCPHCRHTHHAIEGARKKYGDKLAVIALPVPLERSCNDAASGSGHYGACEFAKISIAVWRVDSTKFSEFHDWMFESTRSTSQARDKACQLVGHQALQTELALPHASNYILKHVDLYKRIGRGAVPKLMFPKATLSGQVSSTQTLCRAIERELAVK